MAHSTLQHALVLLVDVVLHTAPLLRQLLQVIVEGGLDEGLRARRVQCIVDEALADEECADGECVGRGTVGDRSRRVFILLECSLLYQRFFLGPGGGEVCCRRCEGPDPGGFHAKNVAPKNKLHVYI